LLPPEQDEKAKEVVCNLALRLSGLADDADQSGDDDQMTAGNEEEIIENDSDDDFKIIRRRERIPIPIPSPYSSDEELPELADVAPPTSSSPRSR
jgi:hypothetical protein